jgi:hypothetical protein
MRMSWCRAVATVCVLWHGLGATAWAQDVKTRLREWDECVVRQFRAATSNAIDNDLAMEFAFGICRTAENAVIASSGQDFATATRMMSEAKATLRRRLLAPP